MYGSQLTVIGFLPRPLEVLNFRADGPVPRSWPSLVRGTHLLANNVVERDHGEAALGAWRLEYIQQADELPGCVFCAEAAGELPEDESLVVHRGEAALAIMNKYPYSSGHLLAAPSGTSARSAS